MIQINAAALGESSALLETTPPPLSVAGGIAPPDHAILPIQAPVEQRHFHASHDRFTD
ncbi:MAG: hypothetical protein ACPGZP_01715 [Panacagrimonas sp.]